MGKKRSYGRAADLYPVSRPLSSAGWSGQKNESLQGNVFLTAFGSTCLSFSWSALLSGVTRDWAAPGVSSHQFKKHTFKTNKQTKNVCGGCCWISCFWPITFPVRRQFSLRWIWGIDLWFGWDCLGWWTVLLRRWLRFLSAPWQSAQRGGEGLSTSALIASISSVSPSRWRGLGSPALWLYGSLKTKQTSLSAPYVSPFESTFCLSQAFCFPKKRCSPPLRAAGPFSQIPHLTTGTLQDCVCALLLISRSVIASRTYVSLSNYNLNNA